MFAQDARRFTMDRGRPIEAGYNFEMAFKTHDGKTADSTGAFLVGELERLDPTMYEPLAEVSWGRDIDLREDVTIADDVSSFTLSTYGSTGSLGTGNSIGNGKAWIGKDTSQITGLSLDIAKIPHQLRPWALELRYTIIELESAAKLGRPIDQQKFEGIQLKHQMDIDEQVYIGDTIIGDTGLTNCSDVTNTNTFPNGAQGTPQWNTKTPDEILNDFNLALTSVWAATGWSVMPDRVGINPTNYGYIATQKVSEAGNVSILKYILDNNLIAQGGQGKLTIVPMKWTAGGGQGGTYGNESTTNRMVVYKKDRRRVRYPMTMLQRTPVQFSGMYHLTTYFCRLGVLEAVYPATIGYFDGN